MSRARAELPNRVTEEPDRVLRHRRGDHELHLSCWDGGHAQTVLLVHGIGMGSAYYGRLRDALALAVNVVAVDLPGFGDTPEPSRSLSMPDLGDLLGEAVLAQLGGPVVAVGHSMGTQVVAELADRHPELVHHLVLIAPTVNASERSVTRQALRMIQDLWGESPRVMLIGSWLYLRTGPRWFIKKFRTMLEHRIEDVLPRLRVPTLVIRGETDRVCPRDWVTACADLIPGSVMT
ncbi:alpha/beta fold hydrolase, partial [Leucobacter sp. M11]|uniref:alpha/beta fold hydrolase n=1 Tax=Leucobacter sp. M11 TaxID=2993565 RepID=UPI002D808DD8